LRLGGYDYSSDGYYFVTLCASDKARFRNSKQAVEVTLLSLPASIKGLAIDYHVVMDDHVHVILIIEGSGRSVGDIVRQFKAFVSMAVGGKGIWQKGYYEHVIRNDKALMKIREYIRDNPLVKEIEFDQFYL